MKFSLSPYCFVAALYIFLKDPIHLYRGTSCWMICHQTEISHKYEVNHSTQENKAHAQLQQCVSYIFWQITGIWLSNLWCSAPVINNLWSHYNCVSRMSLTMDRLNTCARITSFTSQTLYIKLQGFQYCLFIIFIEPREIESVLYVWDL